MNNKLISQMTTQPEPCPKENLEILIINIEERIRAVNLTHYDIAVNNKFPPIMSYFKKEEILDLLEMGRNKYERDLYNYRNGRVNGD